MRLPGIFFILLIFVSGVMAAGPQKSEATALRVLLKDGSSAQQVYVLAKGSDVNLVNAYQATLTGIILVNMDNDKKLLTVKELPIGQSIQIGFDKVGSYQFIYKVSSASIEDSYKRLLIKVVNVHFA